MTEEKKACKGVFTPEGRVTGGGTGKSKGDADRKSRKGGERRTGTKRLKVQPKNVAEGERDEFAARGTGPIKNVGETEKGDPTREGKNPIAG